MKVMRKDHGTAIALFQKALSCDGGNLEARLKLGIVLSESHRDAALPHLAFVTERDPENEKAWHSHAWALIRLHRFEQALVSADKALRLGPASWENFLLKGIVLRCLGRLEEAVDSLQRATEIGGKNSTVFTTYGQVLDELGDHERALTSLRQAVRLYPEDPESRFQLALLQLKLKDFSEGWIGYEGVT